MSDDAERALGRVEGMLAAFITEQRAVNAAASDSRKQTYAKLEAVSGVASATKQDVDEMRVRLTELEVKAKELSVLRERLVGAGMLLRAAKLTLWGTLAAGVAWVWQHLKLP